MAFRFKGYSITRMNQHYGSRENTETKLCNTICVLPVFHHDRDIHRHMLAGECLTCGTTPPPIKKSRWWDRNRRARPFRGTAWVSHDHLSLQEHSSRYFQTQMSSLPPWALTNMMKQVQWGQGRISIAIAIAVVEQSRDEEQWVGGLDLNTKNTGRHLCYMKTPHLD